MIGLYTPLTGSYPVTPWAGFAVLCGYTALALALAAMLSRPGGHMRQDLNVPFR